MENNSIRREYPQHQLDRIMETYEPEYRLLVRAELSPRTARGYFRLRDKPYGSKQPQEHAGFDELGYCLEQLTYAAFGEWLQNGRVENFDIDFSDFLKMRKANLIQVEAIKEGRFRKKIKRKTKEPIVCDIELTRARRFGNTCLAIVDYSFEGGRASGQLEFGILLPNMKLDRNHRGRRIC
ncbi:hypothetical protein GF371_00190 [Candidatus Woesearchaeota archaeon]|nr:hypothetical protein [Candidatus Woesearchaeota archaeon]